MNRRRGMRLVRKRDMVKRKIRNYLSYLSGGWKYTVKESLRKLLEGFNKSTRFVKSVFGTKKES